MNVLIVCDKNSFQNPYVSTLACGLNDVGCCVTCSVSKFWNEEIDYDIVHIQWPNLLVRQMGPKGANLKQRLCNIRKRGIPIVVTLHNMLPHYKSDSDSLLAYDIIYNNADCFIHLGAASIKILTERMPQIKAMHRIILHHVYDALYDFQISPDVARDKLNIPKDVKCILCFGSFRDDEERNLIIDLKRKLGPQYYVLAPGFYRGTIIRKNIYIGLKNLLKAIKYTIKAKYHNIHMVHHFVPDNLLPYYLAASDLVLIQRLKILNSGNVPLAFLAGRPVVGPNVGNVGWLLNKTHNGVFDVSHQENISDVVKAFIKNKECGKNNQTFAKKFLSTSAIAEQTKKVYEEVIRNKNICGDECGVV